MGVVLDVDGPQLCIGVANEPLAVHHDIRVFLGEDDAALISSNHVVVLVDEEDAKVAEHLKRAFQLLGLFLRDLSGVSKTVLQVTNAHFFTSDAPFLVFFHSVLLKQKRQLVMSCLGFLRGAHPAMPAVEPGVLLTNR